MALIGRPLASRHIPITRDMSRVVVTMLWDTPPPGQILMYMRREGAPAEFAVYPPIEVLGSVLTFQFDELLFQQVPGRFIGRVVIGITDYAELQFIYSDTAAVISVENPSVQTCP